MKYTNEQLIKVLTILALNKAYKVSVVDSIGTLAALAELLDKDIKDVLTLYMAAHPDEAIEIKNALDAMEGAFIV